MEIYNAQTNEQKNLSKFVYFMTRDNSLCIDHILLFMILRNFVKEKNLDSIVLVKKCEINC